MIVFTWDKKGFGLYGFNIPWGAWPGVVGGVVAAEGTRKAAGIQTGTPENGILNLTYMVGGGFATYHGIKYLNE